MPYLCTWEKTSSQLSNTILRKGGKTIVKTMPHWLDIIQYNGCANGFVFHCFCPCWRGCHLIVNLSIITHRLATLGKTGDLDCKSSKTCVLPTFWIRVSWLVYWQPMLPKICLGFQNEDKHQMYLIDHLWAYPLPT